MEIHGAHIDPDGDLVTLDMPHDPWYYTAEAWNDIIIGAGVRDQEWVVADEYTGPGSRTRIVYRRMAT